MTVEYRIGDVFDRLAEIPDGSVDLVVTSPPFLALRSYLPADHPDKGKEIGSEATPAEFLDVMLRFTGELRRVLAPHGSIAIELGDTYAGGGAVDNRADADGKIVRKDYPDRPAFNHGSGAGITTVGEGWPLAKSKTLIPELYRIALAYGFNPLTGSPSPAGQWRIRNVVTWCRPNPPVGALGDKWRPATSDVVVACLSGKRYWDDLATRKVNHPERMARTDAGSGYAPPETLGSGLGNGSMNPSGAPLLDYWEIPLLEGEEPKPYGPKDPTQKARDYYERNGRQGTPGTKGPNLDRGDLGGGNYGAHEAGPPLLDYWVIPPGGYAGSHYAVFPPELVVPLVKAMCPQRVCRTCGEPSRRIVEKSERYQALRDCIGDFNQRDNGQGSSGSRSVASAAGGYDLVAAEYETTGWTDCGHDDWRPGLVLDPFAGSGTTLMVAQGHGHDAIGIDLDSRNAELALERVGPFFLQVVS